MHTATQSTPTSLHKAHLNRYTKHPHSADQIISVLNSNFNWSKCFHSTTTQAYSLVASIAHKALESRGAIHSQYGHSGSDRRTGKARGSVDLRGSRQDSQHPDTHQSNPQLTTLGYADKRVKIPTLTKDESFTSHRMVLSQRV